MSEQLQHPDTVDGLPQVVARNLGDRSYEKRKAAALELEHYIKELNDRGDSETVQHAIGILQSEYANSTQPNRRKGGLIGLAATCVALAQDCGTFLDIIITAVLPLLEDSEPRVRYYACEALYNISKVARARLLPFFGPIFRALCKVRLIRLEIRLPYMNENVLFNVETRKC